jgi:hypothetical protein
MAEAEPEPEGDLFKATLSIDVVTPTDPDLAGVDSAIDEFRFRRIPPPPDRCPAMAQALEKRRIEALMDGAYDRAAEYDQLSRDFQAMMQTQTQKQCEDRVVETLFQRWQQLQRQQRDTSEQWDCILRDFLNENGKQLQVLQSQQNTEIELFIARWRDLTVLRPFMKPSQALLQLREQEKAMGIARLYAEAKAVQAEADRLQRAETRAAQARINAQMASERNRLSEKHSKEIEALYDHRERTLRSIHAAREKELRPIETALQQMKAKRPTLPKRPSSLPALTPSRVVSAGQECLCSGRTAARYSIFKSEKKAVLLELPPMDEGVLEQMKNPAALRVRLTVKGRA